jgi:hypothetical protein
LYLEGTRSSDGRYEIVDPVGDGRDKNEGHRKLRKLRKSGGGSTESSENRAESRKVYRKREMHKNSEIGPGKGIWENGK